MNNRGSALKLDVRHVSIPFRFSYGHSKAKHRGVELIVCIVRDSDRLCGYGEAVPRTYVTGETCESVMQDIKKIAPHFAGRYSTPQSIRELVFELAKEWNGAFPSCAFCAIELALLDLIARRRDIPFHEIIGEQKTDVLKYSASIGLGVSPFVKAQLLAYRVMGFKSFKLKVGGEHDLEALRRARDVLGSDVRIFVDANGAWDRETAARKLEQFESAGVWGVEEPLKRNAAEKNSARWDCEQTLNEQHFKDNAWLKERTSISLIADESVISLRSMEAVLEFNAFDVVDIRLSKLGGAMLSSHLVDLARKNGMRFYIGAMVGETPVLANAGAHFGAINADHLCIQGHSHRALHGVSCFKGGMKLKRNGMLNLSNSSGLGVEAQLGKLDKITKRKEIVSL